MALIPINFDDFVPGSITPTGTYESGTNLHLGAKSSPFIEVKVGVTYTFQISYILERLTNVSNPWAWGRIYTYDSNFTPIAPILNYNENLSSKMFGTVTQIQSGVKYIRFCTSHIAHDGVIITINSDEPEPEPEPIDGKVILKLRANGNFETINTPLIEGQPYSFSESGISIPSLIKIPSYKNYFIVKTSVEGHLGSNSGAVEWGSEYNSTSDFIAVSTGEKISLRFEYKGIVNARPWGTFCYYNANKEHVSTPVNGHLLGAGVVEGIYTNTITIPNDVAYLRVSTNLFRYPTTEVKISIQKAPTASLIHQPAIEDLTLPEWVVDTGNPISFFPQGVVIKGNLIETVIEPPVESDIIFADDFNRADSNTLGENWINGRGSWGIENNKVRPTVSNSIALCVHPHGDNVSISADITRVRSDGIVFRARDSNNHLYVQFENDVFRLKSLTNGIVTTLQTADIRTILNQTYRTRIELRGTEIKAFVDDVLCITHETSAYLNDSLCGYQSWSQDGNNGRFDNFEIRKLPAAIPNNLIFSDDFNRPNSNTLGLDWEFLSGGFSIVDGLARNHIVTLPDSIAVTNVDTQNDVKIELGVLIPNIREGIVFRVIDVHNYIRAQYNSSNNSLSVVIRINNVDTVLAETFVPLTRGESYSFRVELRDEEIKVFMDNELKLTTSESRFIDTEKCGILGYSMDYTNGGYDSFEVRRLEN